MNCMKCGRDIEEGQVFCASCLEDMRQYPVKPGIAIQLPIRKEQPMLKKMVPKRKQALPPEEQVKVLKKRLRRIIILWLITLCLLAATIYPTMEYFFGEQTLLPGQNYSTFIETNPTEP